LLLTVTKLANRQLLEHVNYHHYQCNRCIVIRTSYWAHFDKKRSKLYSKVTSYTYIKL